ncbi:MAG: UDP-N-acetylglucosamine 1-carboxyvinyltransferase [Andreesenia angusta]|nr:UDP-N-acetylglucosamine 1-carboxyvinyltransferase [Andreesenia angusta]
MKRIIIEKSPPLKGSVRVSGAKNSALPILAATLLSSGTCRLEDVPDLNDVKIISEVLEILGAKVEKIGKEEVEINASDIRAYEAPYELMNKMRASFLVMGPLLARLGRAKIAMPGGCAIGSRPIDLHLKGFKALGAEIIMEEGFVEAKADKLVGNEIYLDFPSVGATQNILMVASLAEGETILQNAAMEPEITDLANYINKMGGDIRGAGTSTIRIKGVNSLNGVNHQIIPDRIEAGTYMVGAAITKGDIMIENVLSNHIKPVIAKLNEIGAEVLEYENSIRVIGDRELKGVDIKTLPYPGFPTDMQSQFMTLLSVANGKSTVEETVFENRFMHVDELIKMGANIVTNDRKAIINGVNGLKGAKVKATDLRAGASLILAGLIADGVTEISDIYHIDRGYSNIEEKILNLGGKIYRRN